MQDVELKDAAGRVVAGTLRMGRLERAFGDSRTSLLLWPWHRRVRYSRCRTHLAGRWSNSLASWGRPSSNFVKTETEVDSTDEEPLW